PGSTNRLETLAQLVHRRDHLLPYFLYRLRTTEAQLDQFAALGPEQARMAATYHHRVSNARKAYTGQYQGLLDPPILEGKAKAEESFRRKVSADGELRGLAGEAWKKIATTQKTLAGFEKEYYLL